MDTVLGIDLGGTNVKGLALSRVGEVLAEAELPTDDGGDGAWRERVRSIVRALEQALGSAAGAIGVAAPGLAAPDGRSIAHLPGRLAGLQGVIWQELLGRVHPVPVLNDAQAALLGETWRGAAAGAANALLVTLGTGVGGAAMVDGRVLHGHLGRAGHVGHVSLDPHGVADIVGTPGSLEDAIGECSLGRRGGGRFGSTRELVQAFRAGDAEAAKVWLASLEALAAGLVSLINVLDPAVIVLGGGITEAGDALFGPLEERLRRSEWQPGGARVRLVRAQLGTRAGAFGAARHALQLGEENLT